LNQDIDGLDVKLLFGIYQKKVLGYEERVEEVPDILEKIILAKKIARQIYKQKPGSEVQVDEEEPNDKETPYESPIEEIEKPKLEKHAKNSPRLQVAEKSYLAQFYIKPSYNVNNTTSTTQANNPTPLNVDKAEYFDNPVVASLSPKVMKNMVEGYNLNFEPYATKFDNKLVVDDEVGEVIGIRKRRESEVEEKALEKSNIDLKFEF